MTHVDSLTVSTDAVAEWALRLSGVADLVDDWCEKTSWWLSRYALLTASADWRVIQSLGEVASVLRGMVELGSELRRDADTTAAVAEQYLSTDQRLTYRLHEHGARVALALLPLLIRGGGLPLRLATFSGTGLAAWWAFTRPSRWSVGLLRGAASILGRESVPSHPNSGAWITREFRSETPSVSAGAATVLSAWFSRNSTTLAAQHNSTTVSAVRLRVTAVDSRACLAPSGFADLVSRIPAPDRGEPQVRIDRVGQTAFVYIGGTVDGSWNGGAEPWDMSSNIRAMGGQSSDSELAVLRAMSEAKVSGADRIVLVGHSQGGLIAQRIAAHPEYRVTDLFTVGSPVQAAGIPETVRVMNVENVSDPIPALGGYAPAGTGAVVVRSESPVAVQGDGLAAHHLETYVRTAREMDENQSPLVEQTRGYLFGSGRHLPCESSRWRIDREVD